MAKDSIFRLCDQVRETAFALHKYLKHGHREVVYKRGLAHRLSKQGLAVQQESAIDVFDEDGTRLGDFAADLVVNGRLLLELKACPEINSSHIAQTIGYLVASEIDHGLLINFGAQKLQIKKLISPRSGES